MLKALPPWMAMKSLPLGVDRGKEPAGTLMITCPKRTGLVEGEGEVPGENPGDALAEGLGLGENPGDALAEGLGLGEESGPPDPLAVMTISSLGLTATVTL
jgi:hypothetical protein